MSTRYNDVLLKGNMMLKFSFVFLLLFADAFAGDFGLSEQANLLFFGAFAMIIVYNFGYTLVLKSATYASYLMFHASLFIIMLFYTGTIERSWFDFNLYSIPIGVFFLSVAMLLAFSRDYLDLKLLSPKIENFVNKLIILNLGLLFLSAYSISNTVLEISSIILLVFEAVGLLVFSAYLAFGKGSTYARFYCLSFSFLFIVFVISGLGYFGIADIGENAPYLFEFAILFEAVGLSFALAYKQNESEVNLRQNELLFQELSHRIQNSLQQIISILTLQINDTQDVNVKAHLQESINRISSISLIHKTLQGSLNLGKVNMHTYLNALIEGYKGLHSDVKFTYECSKEIELSIDKVTPLALIINELITNSIKHAFKERDNAHIHIELNENRLIHFNYEDNGSGFQEEMVTNSIGSKLINILSKSQLKGQVLIDSDKRYFFSLKFSQ